MRRIIKAQSDAVISDNLLIDYVNRFWLMDVDARIQLFDLKTTYRFQTVPNIDKYNMPLYQVQIEPGSQNIAPYPVYQGFSDPCYVNGIQFPFYTQRDTFYNLWPNYVQGLNPAATGNGTPGPYTLSVPYFPAIPGHVDMLGIIASGSTIDPIVTSSFITTVPTTSVYSAVTFTTMDDTGTQMVVSDSGQFLAGNVGYGLLMSPGAAPYGNTMLDGGYSTTSNTVNYATGVATMTFPAAVPAGMPINAQSYYYESGIPRAVLFYNNTLTIRPPPNISYLVEIDAYLSPAAFLSTSNAVPFGYMSEYIARGAARKLLSDTGDIEQFSFYEALFREQEILVWKRSQRQFTATRTQTIFSSPNGQNSSNTIGTGSN